MNPQLRLVIASFCVLVASITANAQAPKTSPLSEINTYVATVDRFIKLNPNGRYFGDLSVEEKSNWKQFKTKKQLDDKEDIYEKALVWTRTGKVVCVTFTLSSPSGDWAHFVTYYFRPDGSLAKIHAELNTFYGEVSIIRNRWYHSTGEELDANQKILDLQTRKPKKPTGDFMDQEVLLYKTISDLPFSNLL